MTVSILVHYNLKLLIWIKTDALRATVLRALSQSKKNASGQIHWHSVVFWFCKMMLAEHNYDIENAEMLVIVMTFKQWWHYLKEVKHVITIIINHANLQMFITIKKLTCCHARWYEHLSEFDFKVIFRQEQLNLTDLTLRQSDYINKDLLMFEMLQLTLHSVLSDQTELSSETFLQNSIENLWLLAVLTDTDDYEHLVSQQTVTKSTDVKTVYDELLLSFNKW